MKGRSDGGVEGTWVGERGNRRRRAGRRDLQGGGILVFIVVSPSIPFQERNKSGKGL